MREINRDRIRELVDNNIFPLYMIMRKKQRVHISLRLCQTQKYVATLMHKAGYTKLQIAHSLGIEMNRVRPLLLMRRTKVFDEAVKLIKHPLALLRKGEEYSHEYTISLQDVEYLIIEDLVRAGMTTNEITKATGFHKRRIQRIRINTMEKDND